MTDLWSRFRHLPRWLQVVIWTLLWPVPLCLWAAGRPPGSRRGPAVLAVASALVWIAIPLSASSSEAPTEHLLAGGPGVGAPAAGVSPTTGPAAGPAGAAEGLDGPDGSVATSGTSTAVPTTSGPAASTKATTGRKASPSSTATTRPPVPPATGDPTAVLAGLRVAPEGPRTGYQRELFKHWIDADHDGCNTREEVLIAESTTRAQVDPYGCKVLAGDWFSSYDGLTFTDPSELDIDHMVPLAEAWDSGASAWDAARRQAYANDLDHPWALRAVSASSNRSKGDLDPAQWKPTRDAAWCEYATEWVAVKKAWDLSADQDEIDDLRVMLRTCGAAASPPAPPAPASSTTTTAPPPVSGGAVTISALDCQGERVTVRNGGTSPADLTGWSIHDEASTPHTYRFPAGFTLAPGASVTVRSGGPAGPGELAWTNSNVWNNDGDTATLVNAGGAAVSTKSC